MFMNTSYSAKQLITAIIVTVVITTVAIIVFVKNSPNTLLGLSSNTVASKQCTSEVSVSDEAAKDNVYFVGCGGFF